MDIALILPEQGRLIDKIPFSDIKQDGIDFLVNHDLETAVIISLFANRRAKPDDMIDGTDRQGWWGDTYATAEGDQIGSRLWELRRQKQIPQVLNKARDFCYEALQWMIDDKVADSIFVETEFIAIYTLGIGITIYRPQGAQNFKFQYVWSQI